MNAMKVLGITFSARQEGNCLRLLRYCMDKFKEHNIESEILNGFDLKITPCSHCDYECFADKECPITDDVPHMYKACKDADILLFAIPTYSGHLSSLYFAFAERSQYIVTDYEEFLKTFLRKVNLIIIGNLSAGGDMALHEALYSFSALEFLPKTLLFSAEEYNRSSIKGDLLEVPDVRKRLDKFVERIVKANG